MICAKTKAQATNEPCGTSNMSRTMDRDQHNDITGRDSMYNIHCISGTTASSVCAAQKWLWRTNLLFYWPFSV
jgi:hypothetical protein